MIQLTLWSDLDWWLLFLRPRERAAAHPNQEELV